MLDGIPLGQLLDGFGTVTIVVVVGLLLFTGRLVTRREHEGRIADRDAEISLLRETVGRLTGEVGETLDAILRAVKRQARAESDERRRNP